MRPHYIHLSKREEGNPVNKLRESFNHRNETILYLKDPVGIVFIGDSITDYWDLDSYFALHNGKRIINRGIGNDRSQWVRERFVADAIQLKPNWIVLAIGINNTKELDDDQTEANQIHIKTRILEDIEAMVIMAKAKNINIAVATLTSTNRPQLDGFITRSKLVKAINLEIVRLCIKHDAQFIDYYTMMTETKEGIDYLRNELTDDGLHPHVLGYDRMADTLVKTLPYPIQLKTNKKEK
ncbi:GDSL-type esterase/lipase family protein [Macrococcus psychrotolerans]|uniref:GDSL-type esterase/lipase family protein n=1 Tax=Macrococcus psychrotolerans TaxID=3039389 RepID=A0AAT9P5L4_9STAP|nr:MULTISPECIES: GDSL-type esterase/lipase family protein [Macrococcus]QYA32204.1 G-D-S-L family lipolytic protein [Macrococcus sp. 19Msa1099]QYA37010.1 G-D-S-L family lipolytic protein [Macrococcus caseolyticus]QYA75718.1 G-D-S-L family lipolytic protein [Macrococcus caseolyticus]